MPRGLSPAAKKPPGHIKPGEVVLVMYGKDKILWPSQIKNVNQSKHTITHDFFPSYPTRKATFKAVFPFDKKIPANADSALKDAYEAAFDIINGIGRKSLPKTACTASAEEPTTSHASAMQNDASSSSKIQGKFLASAVMSDAPEVKFVKDEVVMAPNRDEKGILYQWPALIRGVKKNDVVITFFPVNTKEVQVSEEYAAISPFPVKHARAMIDEASHVSPDLAEALHDAVTYLELNGVEVPPDQKKKGNATSKSDTRSYSTVKDAAADILDGSGTSADAKVPAGEEDIQQQENADDHVDQLTSIGSTQPHEQRQSTSGSSLAVMPTTDMIRTGAPSTIVSTPRVRKPKMVGKQTLPAKSVTSSVVEGETMHTDTPLTSARRRPRQQSHVSGTAQGDSPALKKKQEMPVDLSAEEQLSADHLNKEHNTIQSGARVFGRYEQAFYPAIVCGPGGPTGHYRIFFVEDKQTGDVSSADVIPLSDLNPGVKAMISPVSLRPNSIGREIEIVSAPDSRNPQEWKEGKFTVRDAKTGEESNVVWTQFYFRLHDAEALKRKDTGTSRACSTSTAKHPPNRQSTNPLLESTASGPLGTSGLEQESDDVDEVQTGQGEANKDTAEQATVDAVHSEGTSRDANVANEQDPAPKAQTSRGTVSSCAHTPARRTPQKLPTPSTTRKRGATVDMGPPDTGARPTPKRQRRSLKNSQTPIVEDMHVEPPVSTPILATVARKAESVNEAQSDPKKDHNALSAVGFTKVHVQKQSPGNLRYTSTPRSGSSKYQHTERIASERRARTFTAAVSPLVSTLPPPDDKSVDQPDSGKNSVAGTSASNSGIARARKSLIPDISTPPAKPEMTLPEDCESKLDSDQQPAPRVGAMQPRGAQHTPSSRRSAKSRGAEPAVGGTPVRKKQVDVPEELGAEEQLAVDHPHEEHNMILRGARVFGQYKQAFYPATICHDDGLSRYTIYFIEDSIIKVVPNNGIFPLSKLVPGVTTMISPTPDDLSPETIGREIEVVAVPDSNNAEEWKEGKFKVRDIDTGEEIIVVWTQFYFRKQDADTLKLKETATPLVKQSSIVLQARSSRRDRAAFNQSATEHPRTPATTIPMARRSRPSTANKEGLDKTQTASTSHDDVKDTAGPSELVPLARRSSKYDKRVKPTVLSEDADKKAVGFEEKFDDESSGPTTAENTAGTDAGEKDAAANSDDATVIIASASRPLDQQEEDEEAIDFGKMLEEDASLASSLQSQEDAPRCGEVFERVIPTVIFLNRKFLLTASTRTIGQATFDKGQIRGLIQQHGGTVIHDFEDLGDNDAVYLVADTHCRTPNYLTALALSVPCVHHTWISECVKQNELLDVKPYMLPAGNVVRPDGTSLDYAWKPRNAKLMAGKKVWIHGKKDREPSTVDFVEQWSPLIARMGAEVILDDRVPQPEAELFQWLTSDGVDFIVSHQVCEPTVSKAINASKNFLVVNFDRIIETLITGELPDRTDDCLLAPVLTEEQAKSRELFKNRKFVLSCSTRNSQEDRTTFNKRELGRVIEEQGGLVVAHLADTNDEDDIYLIADTHYRTHKYLMALVLSVPCVRHTWITDSAKQGTLLDFKDYLLPAGEVTLPDGVPREYGQRRLNPDLLAGKKVWIHWKKSTEPCDVDFVKLWSPVIAKLRAEVVLDEQVPQTERELQKWLKAGRVDYLLTNHSCDPAVVTAAIRSPKVQVVTCEWLTEAVITGSCPDAGQPQLMFGRFKFILSCAMRNRRTGQPSFNKGEVRRLIEQHGGEVYEDFQDVNDPKDACLFLIADTYCRTPKYLSALSLSMKCVRVDWITESIKHKECLDFNKYTLPAGEALGPDGGVHEFEWKPFNKPEGEPMLMTGKKIWVHSSNNTELIVANFVELWSSIVANLGAEVIHDEQVPEDENERAQWINAGGIDILLTDAWCEPAITLAVETSANAAVVGSEWVIQALITHENPDPIKGHYMHDAP